MSDYQPHPLRIQRKRTKGFRLPPGAVCVTRPGRFDNCFDTAERFDEVLMAILRGEPRDSLPGVDSFRFAQMMSIARSLHELRGKLIACWCPLDRECHGDILARAANK